MTQGKSLTERQQQIINKAADLAHKANADDPAATVDFFVKDYTDVILTGADDDKAELYFAIASLDLLDEAQEITGLTEQTALAILQESHDEKINHRRHTMQELNQTLNTIKSKQKLGLPLTDRERALWTLYGDNNTNDAATAADAAATARAELNDYARKGEFVAKYLSPMLAAADMNVETATYRCHVDTHEEYVDIVYKGGHKRRVCVTADSLQALILDVMR